MQSEHQALHILVTMPTFSYAERLKLEGILAYAHEKSGQPWEIELDADIPGDRPARPDAKSFDGVIAYVGSDADRRRLLAAGVPLVLIEDLKTPRTFPKARNVVTLLCDHEAEGRTAADYFLERHFTNFAFVGVGTDWSDRRGAGFRKALAAAGRSCRFVAANEVADLPRPCAVFAAHDIAARGVLAAARNAGLTVPGDIAVLGIDNDEVMCTTASPALSSIPTGDRSLGFAAGRVLNELILRRARGGRVIRVVHRRVISRLSTDTDAIADPLVALTLRYARTHLFSRLDAATLARRVNYSKLMLQMRVERALGHSLGEEIRRLRLSAAAELLAETDKPIAEVAEACGFTSVSHLALRVREAFGLTPLAYRRACGKNRVSGQGASVPSDRD